MMKIRLFNRKFKLNAKLLFMAFVVMIITGLLMSGLFYGLYISAKDSLVSAWKNNVTEAANSVDYYLKAPIDAVNFSSITIDEMINKGSSSDEIREYLKGETEVYSGLIEGINTGLYGYIRGEYLDGSGWVPNDSYDPKERPWYTDAISNKGRTVISNPFLNEQTHIMMISASKLLSDGESVIAVDLFMVEFQDLLQRIIVQNNAEEAIILDKNGMVIAHSDYLEVGKDYSKDRGEFGKALVDSLIKSYDGSTILENNGKKYATFFDRCSKDWYIAVIINEKDAFSSLRTIYFAAAVVLFLVMAATFVTFNYIGYKQNEVEHLGNEVLAVADIYMAMIAIDIETDMISVIRKNEDTDVVLGGNYQNYSSRISEFVKMICAERFVGMLGSFLDLSTLDERMESVNTITCEFVDANEHWLRMRYISMKRHDDGRIAQVLLAVESIDDDKKKQEKLRMLSETDRLTGIMNRGSGEQRIRETLPTVSCGMFCLMDADKFKLVNDTFGHAVGDKVLIAIAKALKDSFRDSDVVFRLGGDEFAAFVVEVKDTELGSRILQRFFNKIDQIEIPEMNGKKISISMGVAFYDAEKKQTFEKLYELADKGTYLSKKVEGNKFTFCEDE
ncbi:sensor domain-containing diguanylate cyclase [Butyrivibrio sp. WCE2006]|uniref:sensor domain-containing diguanylate cyclase n=1 Tax=Butyrivibrio sp. WCE2006 TaxID=1410611 RepID=UPI0009DEF15C|nr:sensor domain-containing diguanylate cyclase [Butyrivibrio sp. WCE2006]